MPPALFDPHVCSPPKTFGLPRTRGPITFHCDCGRRWHIERFYAEDGRHLGESWILDEETQPPAVHVDH